MDKPACWLPASRLPAGNTAASHRRTCQPHPSPDASTETAGNSAHAGMREGDGQLHLRTIGSWVGSAAFAYSASGSRSSSTGLYRSWFPWNPSTSPIVHSCPPSLGKPETATYSTSRCICLGEDFESILGYTSAQSMNIWCLTASSERVVQHGIARLGVDVHGARPKTSGAAQSFRRLAWLDATQGYGAFFARENGCFKAGTGTVVAPDLSRYIQQRRRRSPSIVCLVDPCYIGDIS